jgi:hypothetical protein
MSSIMPGHNHHRTGNFGTRCGVTKKIYVCWPNKLDACRCTSDYNFFVYCAKMTMKQNLNAFV